MNSFRHASGLGTASSSSLQTQTSNLSTGILPELQESSLRPASSDQLIYKTTLSTVSLIDSNIAILFDPGSTLGTAKNLGGLAGAQSTNGWVGSTDLLDVYRVTIGAGNLNVSLTNLAADVDIRVIRDYNGNGVKDYGETIASSSRGGLRDEAINLAGLASGEYFIEVARFSGDTSYKLRLSNSRPNDLLAVETDLGTLDGTQVFSGQIGNTNTSDTYRFSVSNINFLGLNIPRTVNATLSGLSADSDIRLIHDVNNNGIVDSGDVLTGSYRSGTGAEMFSSALQTGTYFIQVNQFNGSADYHLGISTGDWFSSNLSDAGILGEARYSYYVDGAIGRRDMLNIFDEAKDYGAIDAAELNDLRAIVNNAAGLAMPDHVRVLTRKVVYSDPANAKSGIGNLFAGSSATQLGNLVSKWFLGTDRPTAAGTYRYANGSLFQGCASYSDVDQGGLADCYFLAALGAVALKTPSKIYNMFTDNGDGTFTVRFFNNGVADYVTVDRYLPTHGWGGFVYANDSSGLTYDNPNNELWVALAEKAYAQMNESGWIGQDNTNTYDGIGYGWGATVMRQVTGQNAEGHGMNDYFLGIRVGDNVHEMWNAFAAGRSVVVNSNGAGVATGIVANHAYVLTGYNYATGKYVLYNPWAGTGATIELTKAQLSDNFGSWDAIA
jgi:hypothetical protein